MNVMEYGTKNRPVIVLLHGGGLSWWNFREQAERLSQNYRVLLPILDGHGDSDEGFHSIEENARRILAYIDEQLGGAVEIVGGLSLGAQIALEILSQRANICSYAIIESAAVLPDRLTAALVGPSFSACYGLIRQAWFSRLQFQYLRIRQDLFEDYDRDSRKIQKADLITFVKASALYRAKPALGQTKAKVLLVVGQKESSRIQRSARLLQDIIPGSVLRREKGLHHGAFSLNHGERYAETLMRFAHRERAFREDDR